MTPIQQSMVQTRIEKAQSHGWNGYEQIRDNPDGSVTVIMLDKSKKRHFLRVGVDGKCAFQPVILTIK